MIPAPLGGCLDEALRSPVHLGLASVDDLDQFSGFKTPSVSGIQVTSTACPAHFLPQELCKALTIFGVHS